MIKSSQRKQNRTPWQTRNSRIENKSSAWEPSECDDVSLISSSSYFTIKSDVSKNTNSDVTDAFHRKETNGNYSKAFVTDFSSETGKISDDKRDRFQSDVTKNHHGDNKGEVYDSDITKNKYRFEMHQNKNDTCADDKEYLSEFHLSNGVKFDRNSINCNSTNIRRNALNSRCCNSTKEIDISLAESKCHEYVNNSVNQLPVRYSTRPKSISAIGETRCPSHTSYTRSKTSNSINQSKASKSLRGDDVTSIWSIVFERPINKERTAERLTNNNQASGLLTNLMSIHEQQMTSSYQPMRVESKQEQEESSVTSEDEVDNKSASTQRSSYSGGSLSD